MREKIQAFVNENIDEVYKIIYDLCQIPAPSGHEEKRAEYCRNWFLNNGMKAYIDEALNVIYPYQVGDGADLSVIEAHTDTVFPDTEPMPYIDDGEFIRAPGVGDDTASVAALMLCAKYFNINKIVTSGVLFVCNSCEEGLGNLKGTRQLFKDFAGRIKRLISFDAGKFAYSADRAVGSHRYEVTASTVGGHSWSRFGNKNAIAALSEIVTKIYSLELPKKEGKKLTYNVGTINGGTSVNTIAQNASMLCEYRSDDVELLANMKEQFERIFDEVRSDEVKIDVKLVGDRPCASNNVDENGLEKLRQATRKAVKEVTGEEKVFGSSSTDCNIPLSLGIPAITIGTYIGAGAHTREEWIRKDSVPTGLEIAILTVLGMVE